MRATLCRCLPLTANGSLSKKHYFEGCVAVALVGCRHVISLKAPFLVFIVKSFTNDCFSIQKQNIISA